MTEPKPFHKCNESCPLFGYKEVDGETEYCCFIGRVPDIAIEHGDFCHRKLNLVERLKYLKLQRELERERDKLTTKIYHLQLLIDNCGRE